MVKKGLRFITQRCSYNPLEELPISVYFSPYEIISWSVNNSRIPATIAVIISGQELFRRLDNVKKYLFGAPEWNG